MFNDGQFNDITKKQVRDEMMIELVHGQPIRFGADGQRGVVMGSDGQLRLVEVADVGEDALLVHDAARPDPSLAFALARLSNDDHSPTPFGVFRQVERPGVLHGDRAPAGRSVGQEGPRRPRRPPALQRHVVRGGLEPSSVARTAERRARGRNLRYSSMTVTGRLGPVRPAVLAVVPQHPRPTRAT